MRDVEVNSPIASSGALYRATPPQTKLMIFIFPDELKVDQAIDAVVTKLNAENHTFVYRLALAEKKTDGTVCVRDITEDWFGPVRTGAMIGGLSG